MKTLPENLQGFLHIIGIPLKVRIQPSAYVSYIRPRVNTKPSNHTNTSEISKSDCENGYYEETLCISPSVDADIDLPHSSEDFDIVDKMILNAIRTKHPNASSVIRPVQYVEDLKKDIDIFHGWHEERIDIIPSVYFNSYDPFNPNFNKAKAQDLPLTLYAELSLEMIKREVENCIHDNSRFYIWMSLFGEYSSLFDSYKPWNFQDEQTYDSLLEQLQKRPVYDLKSVLKQIHNK